jgi:hypothetical protein
MECSVCTGLALVVVPLVAFTGGAWAMGRLARRFVMTRDLEVLPARHQKLLNTRFGGYRAAAVRRHWGALSKDGLAVARRLLKIDLAFPIVYAGSLFASLWCAWNWFGRSFTGWLVLPFALLAIADWTENTVQLRLLPTEPTTSPDVPGGPLAVASWATRIKLCLFTACLIVVIGAGAVVALKARPQPGPGDQTSGAPR